MLIGSLLLVSVPLVGLSKIFSNLCIGPSEVRALPLAVAGRTLLPYNHALPSYNCNLKPHDYPLLPCNGPLPPYNHAFLA